MVKFIEFSEEKPCFNQVFSGIQLLPYQYTKYVIPFDFTLSVARIWEYFLVDCFGNRTNITDSCRKVTSAIEISKIQYDLDRRVYLEIRGRNPILGLEPIYYYSNLFKISSYDKERTTRIDYKCKGDDTLFSIQVQIFEDHELSETELNKYNQVVSRRSVSYIPFDAEYFIYRSKMMCINTLNKIKRVFVNRYVYFNHERVNLFNVPDISSPDPDTYMIEANFEITKLGESIKPTYVLSTEKNSPNCVIIFREDIPGLYTKDRRYTEYEKNGIIGIDNNKGEFQSRDSVLETYPNNAYEFCALNLISAITTEDNKLIQIENGR